MENVELVKKLRELSRSGSTFRRMICKVAAQQIEKLSAQLAAAMEDLRQADDVCCYCAHREPPAPCFEDGEIYECEKCPRECYCKDCIDNSKWEWRGVQQKEEKKVLLCGNCDHLAVCKYTDAGDGRCQKPQYFRDKRETAVVLNVSPNTMKAMERLGSNAHGGEGQ